MQKFEQEIKDHQDSIMKSIGGNFITVPTPRFSAEKFAELKKEYDVFTPVQLNEFVKTCGAEFIKSLEEGGNVDELKKSLASKQDEVSSLQKVILVDAENKESVVFVRKKEQAA